MAIFTVVDVTVDTKIPPADEEVAAALAAVSMFLEAEMGEPVDMDMGDWQWKASRKLVTQGLVEMRSPVRPSWNHVERLRRSGHGIAGVVGL